MSLLFSMRILAVSATNLTTRLFLSNPPGVYFISKINIYYYISYKSTVFLFSLFLLTTILCLRDFLTRYKQFLFVMQHVVHLPETNIRQQVHNYSVQQAVGFGYMKEMCRPFAMWVTVWAYELSRKLRNAGYMRQCDRSKDTC